jgi:hypothetical protein
VDKPVDAAETSCVAVLEPFDEPSTSPRAGREGKGTGSGREGIEPRERVSARKRAAQLPDGWQPPEQLLAKQRADHPSVDLDRELVRFANHWQSKGEARKDWTASWRNWVLRAEEFSGGTRAATSSGKRGIPEPSPANADWNASWRDSVPEGER